MAKTEKTNTCGCCAGIQRQTPVRLYNRPGQTSIDYRIGSHARFKASMLAALSSTERPAIRALGTRDDDDFTIAYLDGVASLLDVLSFYQERYANEHFLATSTQRRSVLEMARLIGYQLSPGVAAATHLAFTLQDTPGTPAAMAQPITIPTGTRVQSVPGQDEQAQVFETTQDIPARAQWNAVAAQTTSRYVPQHGDRDIYLDGLDNNVAVGDAILLVGKHRMDNRGSERWDVRVVRRVSKDKTHLRTRLEWDTPLGHVYPSIQPSDTDVRLYVFRKRASLFGHNAPDPRLMSAEDNKLSSLASGSGSGYWWNNYTLSPGRIDLASAEDKVVADSWVVLVSNDETMGTADLPGYAELYRVNKVSQRSRTDYGMSSKITRIETDTSENFDQFTIQETLALVASEELPIHARPLTYPVFGDTLALQSLSEDLTPNQYLAVSGLPQRLQVAPGVTHLLLKTDDGDIPLDEADNLQLAGIPEKRIGGTTSQLSPEAFGDLINDEDEHIPLQLTVIDRDGQQGTVLSHGAHWRWADNADDEARIAEIARIGDSDTDIMDDRERTTLRLSAALGNVYRRDSVRINFNVAPATHGESVEEILGDGDARQTDQQFTLKHTPLTYVSADTPSGGLASLEVRVNELLWQETASLYQAGADARVYAIHTRDDGSTTIQFGDGIEGGRLPTGQTNVRARYRKGVGTAANLDRDTLTTLLKKPLGVTEVSNPAPATGGADPEVIDDARQNAPLTVLTLDRAVSVLDYQHYARAFTGVAKAHALWIHSGPSRGIFITLAGPDGAEIPATSSTYANLMSSLRRYGDPTLPLSLVNYQPTRFVLGMAVKVNADADSDTVLASLESTLREYFSFAKRDFGQHVSRDEVLAVAHSVQYVEAVRLTRFYRQGEAEGIADIIPSFLPVASLTVAPTPAHLLTLSDEPLEMDTFS
ncbi:MAG TPA: hypothetical protein ENJ17_01845 [Gammaproteobacteria bacterium]|nr:hypothetical protein [Gammaproteobacteria bacterium]